MSCEKNALLFDRLSVKKVLESYTHIYRFRVYIYLLEFRVISRSSYASSVCSSHIHTHNLSPFEKSSDRIEVSVR